MWKWWFLVLPGPVSRNCHGRRVFWDTKMGRCNLTHLTQHVALICHGLAMENQHPTAPRGPRSRSHAEHCSMEQHTRRMNLEPRLQPYAVLGSICCRQSEQSIPFTKKIKKFTKGNQLTWKSESSPFVSSCSPIVAISWPILGMLPLQDKALHKNGVTSRQHRPLREAWSSRSTCQEAI